jgi:undecaprenyl-diphosphatase
MRTPTLIFQGYLVLAILGFTILAFLSQSTAYFSIDLIVTRTIQAVHTPWLFAAMLLISWPGFIPQVFWVVLVVSALLFFTGLRWESLVSGSVGLLAGFISMILKEIIQRPRPDGNTVEVFRDLASFSFPSGHVMFYTAFFGFLFYLAYIILPVSWKRSVLLGFFAGLIILVGPSRIFLGQHWFSDVIGAYLAGSILLFLAIQVYNILKRRLLEDKSG